MSNELEEMMARADALDVKYAGNIGLETLTERVEEAERGTAGGGEDGTGGDNDLGDTDGDAGLDAGEDGNAGADAGDGDADADSGSGTEDETEASSSDEPDEKVEMTGAEALSKLGDY